MVVGSSPVTATENVHLGVNKERNIPTTNSNEKIVLQLAKQNKCRQRYCIDIWAIYIRITKQKF